MKPVLRRTGRAAAIPFAISSMLAALLLAGCGGSSSSGTYAPAPAPAPDPVLAPFETYANMCATPRTGVDAQGQPYPDKQGTLLDELRFLKSWSDQYYLWYKEIPANQMTGFTSAIDYFKVLKTPALTPSGQPKDRFHFTYPTAEWEALSNAGEDVGYGITWSSSGPTAPRTWLVTEVEPGSPAAVAGIQRGDMLALVDGWDFVNGSNTASIAAINAGLFPAAAGEHHTLAVKRGSSNEYLYFPMDAAVVSAASVKNVQVFDTPTGKVGYLTFDSHNAVAEQQLIDAFNQFKSAGVSDLVLDMRYNGGGLLYVASELAYMIAGPSSAGQVFERPQYNDKLGSDTPIPFRSTAYGFPAPNPAPADAPLPYLGLKRVTVLTTPGTCSASEAVINGLRGIDVEVNLIGGQTCGKPYGFTPMPNCGTTYFSIEFKGVNAKGFGDYPDGFAPTCSVPDDLSHAVGDPQEGMLAAALNYRATNACTAPAAISGRSLAAAHPVPLTLVRPEAKEIAVLTRPR